MRSNKRKATEDGNDQVTLHQGDCMDFLPAMKRRCVDLVAADVPYGEVSRPMNGLRKGDKGLADVVTFDLASFVGECIRISRGWIVIFCGTRQVSEVVGVFENNKLRFVRVGMGVKTAPSPANGKYGFVSGLELCVVGKKDRAPFTGRHRKALFTMPPVHYRKRTHPTEKPIATMEEIIQLTTHPGALVCDPCMGSGSTGVAALNLGRRFVGIELDAGFYAAAERRIRKAARQQHG